MIGKLLAALTDLDQPEKHLRW